MASVEDHAVFNEEELDDDEDDEDDFHHLNHPPTTLPTTNAMPNPSQDGDVVVDEEDDVDVDDNDVDDSTSSSTLAAGHLSLHHHHLPPPPQLNTTPSSSAGPAGVVTIALPADHDQRIGGVSIAATPISVAVMEEKKPAPIDEARRLFQRLWTDEDEIELLQRFLEYTSSRGAINSSHHHDTTAFYDQVKSKFQLDFNKNQLVEKLRRLKKKYRNVMNKIGSGKEYIFKSPHEQATFEISRKIWSGGGGVFGAGGGAAVRGANIVVEEGGFDDEDAHPNYGIHSIDRSPNLNSSPNLNGLDMNSFDKKTPRSRKRSRSGGVKIEEKQLAFNNMQVHNLQLNDQLHNAQNLEGVNAIPVSVVTPAMGTAAGARTETVSGSVGVENPPPVTPVAGVRTEIGSGSVTSVVEETVKSCLSPIFKELVNGVMNMNGTMGGSRSNGLGYAFSPMPLGLNGDLVADEKWRKQQILELEVYSKRLELVQDQIKTQLEELRSMGG